MSDRCHDLNILFEEVQVNPDMMESLFKTFQELQERLNRLTGFPFYQNYDLYNAFIEAKQYLKSEFAPYDIVLGTKNGDQMKIHCLWHVNPGFSPTNSLINFEFPEGFRDPIIEPLNTDSSVNQLFEMNQMISWVAFGKYEGKKGYLVATLAPYITPIGQKEVPKRWNGHSVWQFAMAYQSLNGSGDRYCEDPLMMGDIIGPKDLRKSYGSLGLFLTDASEKIYLMSNYHVLQLDRLTTERKILQPDFNIIQSQYKQPTRLSRFVIADFIPKFSYRGSIDLEINNQKYPFGMDLGIAQLNRKRKFLPQLRYNSNDNTLTMNSEIHTPMQGDYCYKCGATSRLTKGMVTIMNVPVRDVPQYSFYSTLTREDLADETETETTVFYNQVMFMSLMSREPFCSLGDSGSIALSENGKPMALMHGATRNLQYSFGSDLSIVFRFLRTKMDDPVILSQAEPQSIK